MTMTHAIFNATITGANLSSATSYGFAASQLYSTTNYVAHNLSGLNLLSNDFTGWDFSDQVLSRSTLQSVIFDGTNLTNAILTNAILVDADFTGALIVGGNFYASDSGTVDFHPTL